MTNNKPIIITPDIIRQRLESKLRSFETRHGILKIAGFVDRTLEPYEVLSFIDSYRKIIRGNEWYFKDDVETDHQDFMRRFLFTHELYIDHAIAFFNQFITLAEPTTFAQLHQMAITTETMRGREGKGSAIGLDRMLEGYLDRLATTIATVTGPKGVEDVIGLFSTVIDEPFMSGEHELFLDMFRYQQEVGEQLSPTNYEQAEKTTNGLVSKILREYCKYSIVDFNSKFGRMQLTPKQMEGKRNRKHSAKREKNSERERVYQALLAHSGAMAHEFTELMSRVNDMNYINANIEVKYSFKGWPGLLHHLVFKKGRQLSNDEDIHHRQSIIAYRQVGEKDGSGK